MPRHVCDVRRRVETEIDTKDRLARFAGVPLLASHEEPPEDAMGAEPNGIEGPQLSGPENIDDGVSASSRQNRQKRAPAYLNDYYLEDDFEIMEGCDD